MTRGAPLLLLLSLALLAAFVALRQGSRFVAVTARADTIVVIAHRHGMAPGELMALVEAAGAPAADADIDDLARRFAAAYARHHDPALAAARALGLDELVDRALAARGDAVLALRRQPQGVAVSRFLAMAPRYRAWIEAGAAIQPP